MTVIPFPENHSRKVLKPGVLSEIEEVRTIAITATQLAVIEDCAKRLGQLGAPTTAMVLLGVVAAWKVAS